MEEQHSHSSEYKCGPHCIAHSPHPDYAEYKDAQVEITLPKGFGYSPLKPTYDVQDRPFHQLMNEWKDLHDSKGDDYGDAEEPYKNVRSSENLGIPAFVGAVMSLAEKTRRLEHFCKRYMEEAGRRGRPLDRAEIDVILRNEKVQDSFDDAGVFAGIGKLLFLEELNKT